MNLSLTMHRGEVTDADGVIALRVTKNRLLGLGIPPLLLRRIGNDQFAPLDSTEIESSFKPEEGTSSAAQRCADDILWFLEQRDSAAGLRTSCER